MSENRPLNPEEQAKYIKEFAEFKKKELEIKKFKTDTEYAKLQETQKEMSALLALDVTRPTAEYTEKLAQKSAAYMAGAKKRSQFLLNIPEFNDFVPFFPKNLILIGAVTGEGKSTGSANLCYSLLLQGKRPLVITNEEAAEDVYNRVGAMMLGIRYGNHDSITKESAEKLQKTLMKLSTKMHVIDNSFGVMSGQALPDTTTSVEGLDFILHQLLQRQVKEGFNYDAIILDYFQNFSESKLDPKLDVVKVLNKVASKLDQFKNHYNAPIVVFAQLKANSKDKETSAKERLEWCKGIVNKATCFLEMKANKKESTTEWIIHKSRWNDYLENFLVTGWDRGKYVPNNDEFKKKIAEKRLQYIERELRNDKKNS